MAANGSRIASRARRNMGWKVPPSGRSLPLVDRLKLLQPRLGPLVAMGLCDAGRRGFGHPRRRRLRGFALAVAGTTCGQRRLPLAQPLLVEQMMSRGIGGQQRTIQRTPPSRCEPVLPSDLERLTKPLVEERALSVAEVVPRRTRGANAHAGPLQDIVLLHVAKPLTGTLPPRPDLDQHHAEQKIRTHRVGSSRRILGSRVQSVPLSTLHQSLDSEEASVSMNLLLRAPPPGYASSWTASLRLG